MVGAEKIEEEALAPKPPYLSPTIFIIVKIGEIWYFLFLETSAKNMLLIVWHFAFCFLYFLFFQLFGLTH